MRIAQGIVPSMDFGWLIRVRARRRDSEAIIYVVVSALARPHDFEAFAFRDVASSMSSLMVFPVISRFRAGIPWGTCRSVSDRKDRHSPRPRSFEADHSARRHQARLHAVHFHPGRQQARGEGRVGATVLGMTVVKQVAVSIAVAVITVAVAEYVAWVLGQGAP